MSNNPEQTQDNHERSVERTNQSVSEQQEKIANNPESQIELSPRDAEARTEEARTEALETAVKVESANKKEKTPEKHPTTSRRGPISKKERDTSFRQTMGHVRNELPVGSRVFSKIIHNEYIEKTSDLLGNTIARPNAILFGAIAAFIITLLTYTTAKTIGYALSGFETIAAFIIGWIIGIVLDYFRVLFTGKKF